MKLRIALLGLAFSIVSLAACSDDDDDDDMSSTVSITAQAFQGTIQENPAQGDTIGQIAVDIDPPGTTVNIQLVGVEPAGAITFTGNGYLTVADAALFDFESRTEVTGEFTASVGEEMSTAPITITITNDPIDNATLWTGPTLTFEKADGADPTLDENQDRLTDQVIITRGDEGQIYNIAEEDMADKEESPVGTLWAFGSIADDVSTLDFVKFRENGNPRTFVNRPMVMYLIRDNICVDVTFQTWSQNMMGGFSYQRSTPN